MPAVVAALVHLERAFLPPHEWSAEPAATKKGESKAGSGEDGTADAESSEIQAGAERETQV